MEIAWILQQFRLEFEFWHFPSIFVYLKLNCLVTLFDRSAFTFIFGIFHQLKLTRLVTLFDQKHQVFKNYHKIDHFWPFFIDHLSTQNVNVARSDVERDFFCDFQTPCVLVLSLSCVLKIMCAMFSTIKSVCLMSFFLEKRSSLAFERLGSFMSREEVRIQSFLINTVVFQVLSQETALL